MYTKLQPAQILLLQISALFCAKPSGKIIYISCASHSKTYIFLENETEDWYILSLWFWYAWYSYLSNSLISSLKAYDILW